MHPILEEVNSRWRQMFTALAAGDDVPPSQRLRTEGLMEALVLIGEMTPEALQSAMDSVYAESFESPLADKLGSQWQEFFPFPQIPAMGRRAPVYPSAPE
ncbi:MAG: hypothetical protein V7754_12365 [Halioglobus sp.]